MSKEYGPQKRANELLGEWSEKNPELSKRPEKEEPIKVLVVIWDDDGTPNVDLYRGPEAFSRSNPDLTLDDVAVVAEAIAEPGESFELASNPFWTIRYCEVAE